MCGPSPSFFTQASWLCPGVWFVVNLIQLLLRVLPGTLELWQEEGRGAGAEGYRGQWSSGVCGGEPDGCGGLGRPRVLVRGGP